VPKLQEAIRRIYKDIVLGRSTVRVIHAEEAPTLAYPPIFLIGAYRSGTTLFRYVVDSHSEIGCPPETDFLIPLSALITNEKYLRGFQGMGFGRQLVLQKLRETCAYFYGNYIASRSKIRWADKSPGYFDHLEFILELFPQAQFVMIYRHGLDQVHSFTRNGTFQHEALDDYCDQDEDLRIGATRYWCRVVEVMSTFEDAYPEICMSARYEDLCYHPESELKRLFAFLNVSWEPAVMEFYKFPHDVGKEAGRVASTRGFSISAGNYQRWPDHILKVCYETAKPHLERLGYSTAT